MKPWEIATFCVRQYPGTNTALTNLARNTGSTHHTLSGASPWGPEVTFFLEELRERQPRVVLFGAWSDHYHRFLGFLQDLGMPAGIYWTSSSGQMDIVGEIERLSRVIDDPRVRYRMFANERLAKALGRHLDDVHFVPDTVIWPDQAATSNHRPNTCFAISLFCPIVQNNRKNILNCLLALAQLDDDYILYLNGLTENPHYKTLLDTLAIRYQDFGWMSRDAYEETLGRVDLGLQVSFAETFDHVAADHIVRSIPVITSRMVPVMDAMSTSVRSCFVVDNPEDYREIGSKIRWAMANRAACQQLAGDMRNQLGKENGRRVALATKVLNEISSNA